MRISNQQRQQNEARIRAAMDRLLRGEIPVGGNCDISTLAKEADVDRTAFYGTRPDAHLREEFETRLARIREAGDPIGPSEGQISRLKNEKAKLKARLAQVNSETGYLTEFRTTALARLAAQHEEITRLRNLTTTNLRSNIARLPGPKGKDHRAMLTTTRAAL
jgi:hypothetical protein